MKSWFLFWIFLRASLLSFGGLGGLPILHDDLVTRLHWLTDERFGRGLAVGLISPGPNGLYVVSLGYLSGGGRGALLATLAMLVPPFLALPISMLYRRLAQQRQVQSMLHHLGLAVAGTLGWTAWTLVRQTVQTPTAGVIVLVTLVLLTRTRVHVIVPLALAALAGYLLHL